MKDCGAAAHDSTAERTMLVSQQEAVRLISDALMPLIGEGKRYSVAEIEAASGVKARTIWSYTSGDATPGLAALLSLFKVLPETVADKILSHAGLTVARRERAASADEKLLSGTASLTALLSLALEDHRIDHRERARLIPEARALITKLNAFIDA